MVLDSHRSILATGRAASACARGYRVRFHRVTQLVTSLIEARDELTILGLRARLAELDLLVLDELGSRGTRPRRMKGRDIALSILRALAAVCRHGLGRNGGRVGTGAPTLPPLGAFWSKAPACWPILLQLGASGQMPRPPPPGCPSPSAG